MLTKGKVFNHVSYLNQKIPSQTSVHVFRPFLSPNVSNGPLKGVKLSAGRTRGLQLLK